MKPRRTRLGWPAPAVAAAAAGVGAAGAVAPAPRRPAPTPRVRPLGARASRRPAAATGDGRRCAASRCCSTSGPPGARPACARCRCSTASSATSAARLAGRRPGGRQRRRRCASSSRAAPVSFPVGAGRLRRHRAGAPPGQPERRPAVHRGVRPRRARSLQAAHRRDRADEQLADWASRPAWQQIRREVRQSVPNRVKSGPSLNAPTGCADPAESAARSARHVGRQLSSNRCGERSACDARWRPRHGPAQAQDTDRSGVRVEHLRTRDHRSRRQGAHRQGRPGSWSRAGDAAPAPMAAPPRRPPPRRSRAGAGGRRAGGAAPRPATSSSRRWSAPSTASASPGAKPLVEVGSAVKEGEPICIIEAMKIMNEIEADKAGTITQDPVRERPGGGVRPAAVRHRVSAVERWHRCSRKS